MTRLLVRTPLRAWPLAVLAVANCSFFNPLDQPGLRLVLVPHDTAVYIGGQFQERGSMLNSYGDLYATEHVRYAGLDSGIAVGTTGVVTGLNHARARVMVTRGRFADTGWVSVVPIGQLALSRMSDPSSVDVMNVDGSGFMSIVASGQFDGGSPSWVPDSAAFIYEYAIPGGAGSTRLYVADLSGNTRLLYPSGRDPRVSRDGSWVYFDNFAEIWRIRVDGTGAERVIMGGDAYPDPSPDGTQVVTTELFTRRLELAVRTLATGEQRLLGAVGLFPRWSPQGDSIAYWSAPDLTTDDGAIFLIGANGTGARRVSALGRVYTPDGLDWSPDGKWLLARSDSTMDLIQVATGLTLPLGYAGLYFRGSWRR